MAEEKNTIKPTKRLLSLDALRSFTMLMVVLAHAIQFEQLLHPVINTGRNDNIYQLIYTFIAVTSMPVFLMMSGYFTSMTWRRRGVKDLVWNRFKRILLPLVIFTPMISTISIFGWMPNPNFEIFENVVRNEPAVLEQFFENKDINTTAFVGYTPLQIASMQGRNESARWLIESGADLAYTSVGNTALDMARKSGSQEIEEMLVSAGAPEATTTANFKSLPFPLNVETGHLWFLWYLWLMVLMFAVVALILERISLPRLPDWLVLSPARYLWLIPLSLVFQSFMTGNVWGPDHFSNLMVPLQMLAYYAVFFMFGALYFHYEDGSGSDTHRWWLELPIALLLLFPLGITLFNSRQAPEILNNFLVVTFVWLMTFGLIGMFRHFFTQDRQWVRYLSDSSYFLYIMHFPLVLYLTNYLIRFSLPVWLNVIIKYLVTTGSLLIIYHFLVRYTWLGRWLNGPRQRRIKAGK